MPQLYFSTMEDTYRFICKATGKYGIAIVVHGKIEEKHKRALPFIPAKEWREEGAEGFVRLDCRKDFIEFLTDWSIVQAQFEELEMGVLLFDPSGLVIGPNEYFEIFKDASAELERRGIAVVEERQPSPEVN